MRGKNKHLKEALLEVQSREFSHFPTEEELDLEVTFSPQLISYIKRLSTIADRKEHKFIYLGMYPIRKIVAVVIIVIILSSPITVPAIARGIIQIIQMIYNDRVDIHHGIPTEQMKAIPTKISYYCEPTWLPEGYQIQERTQDHLHSSIIYTAKDKDPIYFYQYILSEKGISLDGDDTTLNEILIQGTYPGIYTTKDDFFSLTWNDGYYQYHLIGNFDYQDMLDILNSVKPIIK